jgi:hypothetical protein
VFWYFSIIPRLKRWFANKKESELLRLHKEKHKQDVEMIRYPTDTTLWKNIDSQNPEFAIDLRKIRIAMTIDGMKPLMNNSTYSTWPIGLSGLIPGPQQLGNDINTYFRPLVEDLKVL